MTQVCRPIMFVIFFSQARGCHTSLRLESKKIYKIKKPKSNGKYQSRWGYIITLWFARNRDRYNLFAPLKYCHRRPHSSFTSTPLTKPHTPHPHLHTHTHTRYKELINLVTGLPLSRDTRVAYNQKCISADCHCMSQWW